jgi:hypothetical protein
MGEETEAQEEFPVYKASKGITMTQSHFWVPVQKLPFPGCFH